MDAFIQATLLIGLAEMGDKSQLVALAFALRYSWRTTLAGITVATLVVHLASVGIGQIAGLALPTFWIKIAAGVAFIGFALWTLRENWDDEPEKPRGEGLGPFLTVVTTFFIAELGDKTMLATIALGTQRTDFVGVWLGSTVGMVAADALAILVGRMAGKRLPQRAIQIVAALALLGFGAWVLYEAFAG